MIPYWELKSVVHLAKMLYSAEFPMVFLEDLDLELDLMVNFQD